MKRKKENAGAIWRIFRDNAGMAGYIDASLAIIILSLFLLLALEAMPALMLREDLNNFADKAVHRLEVSGTADRETLEAIQDIADTYQLSPVIQIDTAYMGATSQIQIDTRIVFTASQMYTMDFGFLGSYDIPLSGKAVGYSEVYWK